ncbi:hypothetical protein ACOMHN_010529 [Nucella lapillus]
MDSATIKIIFAFVFVTVTVSEAANEIQAPRMRRSSYLAFPRLGRGYLALPRMGRSHPGNDAAAANGGSCCTTGLKKEWLFGEDGKMSSQKMCEAESCCPDFMEVENTKPDGTFYTMCVPRCSLGDRSVDAASDNMMLSLKRLLRN